MDTKPLERFATQARRDLLAAVDAQTTVVLSTGSVARSERINVVKKLEDEIATHGRPHVIDKVAYTWFNRIIALRFMDAKGYTGAAVVSPASGQAHGQPEILADAKRGQLDTDVMTNKRATDAIMGLLDGSRRSTDAEGEAYALLLTEYCRHWHKAMPFMFEGEGDYTELLVPTGLLAGGAILSRVREVLTEKVCADVEVIGWLYQFYIAERKDEVFAGFKKNKKAGADEIPAATQLFTPHWIVRYLVENSLGRLWMLNRPSSRLVDQMDYYIAPVDEETDFLKVSGPEELTVIDPACGSGHMLTYSFDLLYAIYEEEGYSTSEIPGMILAHNLYGTEIDSRAGSLAAFALAMKAREKQRTFFNQLIEPKICVIKPISFGQDELGFLVTKEGNRRAEEAFWNQFQNADTFGSLIQPAPESTARLARHLQSLDDAGDMLAANALALAHRVVTQAEYLDSRYSVVVANPPYMGGASFAAMAIDFAGRMYPDTKADLFAMFIDRATMLSVSGGYIGMITMQSWMFLKTYAKLRQSLLRKRTIVTMAHLGTRAFDSIAGEVVSTTAFVFANRHVGGARGSYMRLAELRGGVAKSQALRRFASAEMPLTLATATELMSVPGAPIAFWLSEKLRATFKNGVRLDSLAQVKHGLSTGRNAEVVRFWFEVSRSAFAHSEVSTADADESGRKWFPYNKGGQFRRWFGNVQHVLRYDRPGIDRMASFPGHRHDGRSHYFKQGITWSKVSAGFPAFRHQPIGQVFDVAGNTYFPLNPDDHWGMLAFSNSPVATHLLAAIAPTLNFEAGNVSGLPIVRDAFGAVAADTRRLVEISKSDWDGEETSWDFKRTASIEGVPQAARLVEVFQAVRNARAKVTAEAKSLEESVNRALIASYELDAELDASVPIERVSLLGNPSFRYGREYTTLQERTDFVSALVSYCVGCIFGRYSLDEPGLVLADQGATLQDYLAKVPSPTFRPDTDNVIPFVDEGWFEDDIVDRLRQFLRATFGTQCFEENMRFVEESLGVKELRDYFITKAGKSKFYDDHVQRYKKRPIYWMFSSPKGSFNALIYMHRYTPSTVSTVLNEYLREYRAKLEVTLANAELAKELKETDRLRRVLVELAEYEHDVLYPLASQQISIDLDDGVKTNYPKFYPALRKISGLETAE